MAKTQTQIGIRVTNDFKARLERQADKERRSVSNLILKVMEEYLEQLWLDGGSLWSVRPGTESGREKEG